MVETIKTATAVEEGRERGVIMEATRAKTNIGNPQQGNEKRNGCKEGRSLRNVDGSEFRIFLVL